MDEQARTPAPEAGYWPSLPEPRNKRRFQFGVRTLLVGAALVAVGCYFGQLYRYAQDRKAILADPKYVYRYRTRDAEFPGGTDKDYAPHCHVSIVRMLLGDQAIYSISLANDATDADEQRLRRMFPEAVIVAHECI